MKGIQVYLLSIERRIRALEKENVKLKSNNEHILRVLKQIFETYQSPKKYQIRDLIDSLGKFFKDKENTEKRDVDLISEIIKRSR